jgi:hypothetical protein
MPARRNADAMKRALEAHKLEVAESGEEVVVPETKKADAMDVDEPAAAEAKKEKKKVRRAPSCAPCCADKRPER